MKLTQAKTLSIIGSVLLVASVSVGCSSGTSNGGEERQNESTEVAESTGTEEEALRSIVRTKESVDCSGETAQRICLECNPKNPDAIYCCAGTICVTPKVKK